MPRTDRNNNHHLEGAEQAALIARRRLVRDVEALGNEIMFTGKRALHEVSEQLSVPERIRKHPWSWILGGFGVGIAAAYFFAPREDKNPRSPHRSPSLASSVIQNSPVPLSKILLDGILAAGVHELASLLKRNS